ncbi:cytochrome c1 [Limibaculum sp. M0105]|uniref:Cytochrome c1 n=1 Tax=Thermohalobaculum xanthum TaxID=2753746 RepID=A0A8J7SFV6_9RHOB|nr:cytochrome c1 [Thermohalobaculum xanthum]MBK0400396.1 cytochrome c1 [Thermohalobaculum xanthum]
MLKSRIIPAMLAASLALPGAALAAGGETHIENVAFSFEGPFGTYDQHQLQRGFQVFNEVCAACHGLKYVAFRDLTSATGPAFPEEQAKAFAANYEVFDPELDDTRPARLSDKFPPNTAAGAPDLSLMAKARAGFHGPFGLGLNQLFNGTGGPEYIYSLLTGYTGEEVEQAGTVLYENTAFPGGLISMVPPLSEGLIEYEAHSMGEGDGHGGGGHYSSPEATVEQMSKDVSAFLMWAAEPKMVERKEAGLRNVLMLIVLAVLLYYTNRKLWAPVKGKDH